VELFLPFAGYLPVGGEADPLPPEPDGGAGAVLGGDPPGTPIGAGFAFRIRSGVQYADGFPGAGAPCSGPGAVTP
jgi:hypothetical protein